MSGLESRLSGIIIGTGLGILATLVSSYIAGTLHAQTDNSINVDMVNFYSTINFIKEYGLLITLGGTFIGSLSDIYINTKNIYKK